MKSAQLFASLALFSSAAHAERALDELELAAPAANAVDVPTNAAVIYRYSFFVTPPDPQIVAAAAGAPVDVDVSIVAATLAREGFVVVRPTAGTWPANSAVALSGLTDLSFTTGAGSVVVDDAPPVVAQIGGAALTYRYVGTVESNFFAQLSSTAGNDALLVHDFGVVGGASPDDGFTGTGNLVWSITGGWPDPHFGDTATARFATMRLDGTFSSWSEPVALALPGDADCDGVDDDHDACPAEPGTSTTESLSGVDGCPGGLPPDFQCEAGVFCADRGGGGLPTCAHPHEVAGEGEGEGDVVAEGEGEGDGVAEGEGEGEAAEGEGDGSGCGAGPGGSGAVFGGVALLFARRRRRR